MFSKLTNLLPAIAAALAAASAANAAGEASNEQPARMTYALFEATVEHADLASCPPQHASDDVFCRLTLASEEAHVWIFSHEADQPLLTVASYPLTDRTLRFDAQDE